MYFLIFAGNEMSNKKKTAENSLKILKNTSECTMYVKKMTFWFLK